MVDFLANYPAKGNYDTIDDTSLRRQSNLKQKLQALMMFYLWKLIHNCKL
jgi:hypothetical protein